jgi:hypothetical protein
MLKRALLCCLSSMVAAIDQLSDPFWAAAPASELNLRCAWAAALEGSELLPLIRELWRRTPIDASGTQRLRDLADGCAVSEENRVLVHDARLTTVLVAYLRSTLLPDVARAHALQALANLAMGSSDHSVARRTEIAEGLSPLLPRLIEGGLGRDRRMHVTVQMWAIDLACKLAVSSPASLASLREHGVVPALLAVLEENTSRAPNWLAITHAKPRSEVGARSSSAE